MSLKMDAECVLWNVPGVSGWTRPSRCPYQVVSSQWSNAHLPLRLTELLSALLCFVVQDDGWTIQATRAVVVQTVGSLLSLYIVVFWDTMLAFRHRSTVNSVPVSSRRGQPCMKMTSRYAHWRIICNRFIAFGSAVTTDTLESHSAADLGLCSLNLILDFLLPRPR